MPNHSVRLVTIAGLLAGLVSFAAQANSGPMVDPAFPHPQPPYPEGAQLSGEQGTVVIDLLVSESGRPMRARIKQSSGFDDLDTAALQGVMNWRFLQGSNTDWTSVKIVYQLPVAVPSPTPASTQAK